MRWQDLSTFAMCGRFTLRTPMTLLSQQFLFDLHASEESIAATDKAKGIAADESYLALSLVTTALPRNPT